jgi:hypothetical protein
MTIAATCAVRRAAASRLGGYRLGAATNGWGGSGGHRKRCLATRWHTGRSAVLGSVAVAWDPLSAARRGRGMGGACLPHRRASPTRPPPSLRGAHPAPRPPPCRRGPPNRRRAERTDGGCLCQAEWKVDGAGKDTYRNRCANPDSEAGACGFGGRSRSYPLGVPPGGGRRAAASVGEARRARRRAWVAGLGRAPQLPPSSSAAPGPWLGAARRRQAWRRVEPGAVVLAD